VWWECPFNYQLTQLLSEREEDVLQLSEHHGPILHLIVKLQALDEILVGAGILGLLHLAVDREELGTDIQRYKI
jgi:hypothetical protein